MKSLTGLGALFMIMLLSPGEGFTQNANLNPRQLQNIDVEEHLGDTIPLNLRFTDQNGNPVTLDQYFHHGKPVLLTLAYYSCPMLCPLTLNGIAQVADSLRWTPGDQYQILTVSFNPRETAEMAKANHDKYVHSMTKSVPDSGWAFLVGEGDQSRALANAVGFEYYYVPKKKMYAHPAVSYVLDEDGKIIRYLYGINHKRFNMHMALLEGDKGQVTSTVSRILLYCCQYDPNAGGYVVVANKVMNLAGIATALLLGVFVGGYWVKEHRKSSKQES